MDIQPRIDKILNYKSYSVSKKIDALTEMDCILYTNLGIDSTKKEVNEARNASKKIYRAIRDNLDMFWGTYYLRVMDI